MNTNSPLPSLTIKEKAVLEFVEFRFNSSGVCPSYQEIKDHFNFASFNSVQNYLKQLQSKGYINYIPHQKRAIQILHSANAAQVYLQKIISTEIGPPSNSRLLGRNEVLSLPLYGNVAAGKPIESIQHDEFIEVPPSFVKKPDSTFVLKVSGDSMIDEGIYNNDLILVQEQKTASSGSLVVATIDDEATVKRIYFNNSQIELRPSNSKMLSMWYEPDKVQIRGVVIGLIRSFL